MVLLTLVPGDLAVHKPTNTRVEIIGYADGNFIATTVDETDRKNGGQITAPTTEFVETKPAQLVAKPAAADPGLAATAQRIKDLQAQVADLQKKLQQAEAERDAAADRAVALVAEARASTAPAVLKPIPNPKILVWILRDATSKELADQLNLGWGILHIQFVGDKLNVVLQREEFDEDDDPQPEARAAAPAPAPEPVRTVAGTIVQPEPAAATEPAGVYASIIRRHDLPIAERIQMMNQHIIDEVMAKAAARNPQPFQSRPLITTGGIQS